MPQDAAATARLANALTEASRTQDKTAFAQTIAELTEIHGPEAMAAAWERISGSLTEPPADWS
ncbi:hypothetical protein ACFWPQ_01865 [Streptomyces sp. NPDC058464]|uniref:hypothetical protein n=1 Tax=Streptomyces sp. NPDC058464 TaxID=3346511 RepID=UPI003667EF86